MTQPTAHSIQSDGWEDIPVGVYLTGLDADDEGGFVLKFRILELPEHGVLYFDGVAVTVGTDYGAHYFQDPTAWHADFTFVPDADWSGEVSFDYAVVDNDGDVSAAATTTITVEGQADAPVVRAGANDQPIPDGGTVQVTTTNGFENGPQLASLADGRSLLIWQKDLTTGQVLGRVIGADGQLEGAGAFEITPTGLPSETQPAVATRADDGFAVAWTEDDSFGPNPSTVGGGDLRAAFFAPGATTPTVTLTVAASADGRESTPEVTAAGDGYLVTWAEEDTSTARIMGQRYSAAGVADGAAFEITTAADKGFNSGTFFNPPTHAGVAVGDDGAVAVAYTAGGIVNVVVVDAAGVVSAPIDASAAAPGAHPVMTRLPDGGFALAWTGYDDDTGLDQIEARLFDADGTPRTGVLELTHEAFRADFVPAIGALPDGRLAAAWIGNHGVASSYDIFTQVFAADGTPADGGPVAVTQTGLSGGMFPLPISEGQPTLTVLSDGTYQVGWVQPHATGGQNHDVFTRTYDPGLAAVSGVAGADVTLPTTVTLTDTDGSEVILNVVIEGLPEGFSLDHGARDGGAPTGDWIIDRATSAAFLDALAAGTESLVLHTTADAAGPLQLQISATSQETAEPASTMGSAIVLLPLVLTANQAPVVSDTVELATNEDAGVVSVDLLSMASDPEGGDLDVTGMGWSAVGWTGPVDFDLDAETGELEIDMDQFVRLSAGESAIITFSYQAADGGGGATAAQAEVIIAGLNETVTGTPGEDDLHGTPWVDEISGLDSDDVLRGRAWDDSLWGGAGDDVLVGGKGADQLDGEGGSDTASFFGSRWAVRVDLATAQAHGGDATGDVLVGIENLIGSARGDRLFGNAADNQLSGGAGRDRLEGGAGDDVLVGGGGGDVIKGGEGDDRIYAAWDGDRMHAGLGADVFIFTNAAGFGSAEIRGLEAGDQIDLSGIDADTGEAGDQAFHLVEAFTGEAGEATLEYQPKHTTLKLDVNGDGTTDLILEMKGDHTDFAGFVF